jgi:hypothetical protein
MNREIYPKVKIIINRAMDEAKSFDDTKIRPEHILLSIITTQQLRPEIPNFDPPMTTKLCPIGLLVVQNLQRDNNNNNPKVVLTNQTNKQKTKQT